MRAIGLGLPGLVSLLLASCATLDTPLVNENYEPPTRAQRGARSDNAMDHVRHGEDPCADESADQSRPAIDAVVHTEEGDDAPVPDDGGGCKVWAPGRFTFVTVRGSKAFTPTLGNPREVASFDRDGTVFRRGLVSNREVGEVQCGKLVLFGVAEDQIVARVEPGVVIATGLLSKRYARAAPCNDRQAVVGAYALMVMQEEADKKDDDDKRKREAERDQQNNDASYLRQLREQERQNRQRRYLKPPLGQPQP